VVPALAFVRSHGDDPKNAKDARMIAFVNHWELLAILAVVLLLFGHRLPGMMRSLGSGITEFKRGLKDGNKPTDPPSGTPPARTNDTPSDGAGR
jgi:sec-independent protein translocase protein TatA